MPLRHASRFTPLLTTCGILVTLAAARVAQVARADEPQTRPAAMSERRFLVWDRVKSDVDATKRRTELEKAAYLGIASSPATPVLQRQLKLPEGVGLVVDYVEPGTPAQAAGLQPYDVAVRLNDQVLVNPPQLAVLVRTFDAGDVVTLTVIREGKPTPLKVKLVEREVKPIAEVAFGPVVSELLVDRVLPPNHPPVATDARAGEGDVIGVKIHNLEGPGLFTNSQHIVADGEIRLPYLSNPIVARGKTALELQQAVIQAYGNEKVLENADVSVTITPHMVAKSEQSNQRRERRR
jgi:hypothetical protein